MKNIFLKPGLLVVAVFMAIVLTSCMERITHFYDGPTVVEFKGATNSFSFNGDNFVTGPVTDTSEFDILIQLVGPHQSTPVNVSISMADSSTAVLGQDVEILTDNLAIPANRSSVTARVRVTAEHLVNGERKVAYLVLNGSGGVQPSANYRVYTINLEKREVILSGRVINSELNVGEPGVTITVTGTANVTTTTDSQGNYRVDGLLFRGNYVVTPSKDGFTFDPPSRTWNNVTQPTPRVQNFLAIPD